MEIVNGGFTTGAIDDDSALSPTTLTLPRDSGTGIKVYPASPVFGWRDLLGHVISRTTGEQVPSFVAYRGTQYQYRYGSGLNELFMEFHLPHDYVPDSEMYVHAHWSTNVVDTGGAAGAPGAAKWYFDFSYADGYGTPGGAADPFIAAKTTSVVQQGTTTQYGHMIAEVAITGAADTASTLIRTKPKVDGLILLRVYRDSNDVADTLNQAPFLHFCDIHYQSNGVMGTFAKNTPFYS